VNASAKRTQSKRNVNAKQAKSEYKASATRMQRKREAIAKTAQRKRKVISKQIFSNRKATPERALIACETIADRMHWAYKAIAKWLQSVSKVTSINNFTTAPIAARLPTKLNPKLDPACSAPVASFEPMLLWPLFVKLLLKWTCEWSLWWLRSLDSDRSSLVLVLFFWDAPSELEKKAFFVDAAAAAVDSDVVKREEKWWVVSAWVRWEQIVRGVKKRKLMASEWE
jgi:hypothetical protein